MLVWSPSPGVHIHFVYFPEKLNKPVRLSSSKAEVRFHCENIFAGQKIAPKCFHRQIAAVGCYSQSTAGDVDMHPGHISVIVTMINMCEVLPVAVCQQVLVAGAWGSEWRGRSQTIGSQGGDKRWN